MVKDILETIFKNSGKTTLILFVLMGMPMGMLIAHDTFIQSDDTKCLDKLQSFIVKLDQQEKTLKEALSKIKELEQREDFTSRQLDMCMNNCVSNKT